jgi:hypothetical protein
MLSAAVTAALSFLVEQPIPHSTLPQEELAARIAVKQGTYSMAQRSDQIS